MDIAHQLLKSSFEALIGVSVGQRLFDVRNERPRADFRQVLILDRSPGDFLFKLFLRKLSPSNAILPVVLFGVQPRQQV